MIIIPDLHEAALPGTDRSQSITGRVLQPKGQVPWGLLAFLKGVGMSLSICGWLFTRQAVTSFTTAQTLFLTLKWKGLGFWMAFDVLFGQVLVLLYERETRRSVTYKG